MHKIVSGFINAFVCVYMRFVYFLLLSFKKMIEMMLFEKSEREKERERECNSIIQRQFNIKIYVGIIFIKEYKIT